MKKRETNPKTKTSFEPHGHLTDTFKDFMCQAFNSEFRRFATNKIGHNAIIADRKQRIR